MSLESAATWLQNRPFAVAIAESANLFPVIETVHVLALVLVVGSIAMIDLRLLGISSRGHSVRALAKDVLPVTWLSFVVAVISGLLMFASNAETYFGNTAFRVKIVLLILAGVNMAVFHAFTYRSVAEWDERHPAPTGARVAGGLSLLFWILVVGFGRWIGFTL